MKAGIAVTVVALLAVFLGTGTARADECYSCFFDPSWGIFFCDVSCPGGFTCFATNDYCEVDDWGLCPCGGGGCFLPGTKIQTEEGLRAIDKLQVGDHVLGMDDEGTVEPCEVTQTYRSIGCSYYLINGTLRVTGTHPFWVNGRWIEVSELKIGDELSGMNREPIAIRSIELVRKGVRVYNIEVSGSHTFFAEGVLAHNKPPKPGTP